MKFERSTTVWSVYLIENKYGAYYCGITTDVTRRFDEHNHQGAKCAKYLRGKGPLKLVFHREVGNKSDAMALEFKVKKLNKSGKDSLIKGVTDIFSL